MSLTGLKKQLNKANQLINEKVGGVKGTLLEEDYVDTEKRVDVCKNLFSEITNKITEYLQPNPTYRAKMMTVNAFNKMSGKNNQKSLYPQTENQLSDIFLKYGKELTPSTFGDCLNETGESFRELADIKYTLEDEVKVHFVEPITKIQENDLKEIMHHRRKVQSRRLDYDCKKRNKDKGSKIAEEDIQMALEKFEDSKNMAIEAMNNFLECEAEHVNTLAEFIKAEMEYHSRTAEILDSLHKSLIERKDQCEINRPARIVPKKMSTFSDNYSSNSEDIHEFSPQISIKPKKESNSSHRVPTCRGLYDFKAENPMELEFQEGDIIRLIQQVDDSWYEGEMQGKKGFFPINYVEVLIPLSE